MPRISVIVPVYNVEKYIQPCIDSILAQTYTDFELILVDDGSSDNCPVICDEYAAKDSRIRVIHTKNSGLSCARNAGIDAARGEYICFVDSDDLVMPEYCQVLLELLEGTTYNFSCCGVCRFPDGGNPEWCDVDDRSVVTNVDFLRMQLEKKTEFGVWNKLFRRELFDTLCFMPGKLNEDVVFSAELVQLHGGVVITQQQLYGYRQRKTGIVATQSKKADVDFLFAGEYLLAAVRRYCPELTGQALRYGIEYPWMFVDPIYVHGTFGDNQEFFQQLQDCIRRNIGSYKQRNVFSEIQLNRMELFSRSKFLYSFNAYARLFRVYLYRLLGKDAYRDGHGI